MVNYSLNEDVRHMPWLSIISDVKIIIALASKLFICAIEMKGSSTKRVQQPVSIHTKRPT